MQALPAGSGLLVEAAGPVHGTMQGGRGRDDAAPAPQPRPRRPALLEAAGVAVYAVQRAGYAVAGRAALVSGGGPVGPVAHLARLMGAAHVVVVESNPYRRGQAEGIGALALPPGDEVVERCRELTGCRGGFDVAFECRAPQPRSRRCSTPCAASRRW